jgi:hypothetical protein
MAQISDYTTRINEGWDRIKNNAIAKLERYLTTGNAEIMFSKKEWMEYYT